MAEFEYVADWKQKKDRLFERKEVESVPQFLEELQRLRDGNYYFRGISRAQRKIVSSIQRTWSEGGCWKCLNQNLTFEKFVTGLLAFAKNSDIFAFCKAHRLMDHEIWGYLQHYGCPTPLIDFTRDPFVSIFFATEHASETQGFCSIYAWLSDKSISPDTHDIVDLDRLMTDFCGLRECGMSDCDIRTCFWERFHSWGYFSHGRTIDNCDDGDSPPELPQNGVAFQISKENNNWCPSITAGRINLQSGLFVYAPIKDESLEEFISRKQEKINGDGETDGLIYQKMKCFDIPARLVKELRHAVHCEGISRDVLGISPCSEEDAVKMMFGRYLNSLKGTLGQP